MVMQNDQLTPTPVLSAEPTSQAPEPVVVSSHKESKDGWRGALSTIIILIAAPLVALALTAFVFQSYEVDGPSMETTLQNRDRLIVLKVQRTLARLTGKDYIPNRGDVIIFVERNLYQSSSLDSEKQLVKRVIGLPGDRVVVKDGKITIYNATHPNGYDPDATNSWGTVITTTSGEIDTIVQEGTVFVCGDNRENSLDSRYFGAVPADDIVGKLILRVYPFDNAKLF